MAELKLIAFDADDLAVVSAHLQDALIRVGDIAWQPAHRRFVAVSNRFDWVDALKDRGDAPPVYLRRRAGLRFERVQAARISGLDLQRKNAVLSLLSVGFEPAEPPAGSILLRFADGAAIRLDVECIEAELKDLGPVWRAGSMPKHDETGQAPKES